MLLPYSIQNLDSGLTLRAQVYTVNDVLLETITTGFTEPNPGMYRWEYEPTEVGYIQFEAYIGGDWVFQDETTIDFVPTAFAFPSLSGDLYCDRDTIELIFGRDNVAKWANLDNYDLDNLTVPQDGEIDTRIAYACSYATYFIDARLSNRTGFTIPLVPLDGVNHDPVLINLASILAGVWLYENRGVQDFDPSTGKSTHRLTMYKTQAENDLEKIAKYQLRIGYVREEQRSPILAHSRRHHRHLSDDGFTFIGPNYGNI